MRHEPINLYNAHQHLIIKFAPLIWPEDERLQDPVKLMETVAERLWTAAQNEKDRRTRLLEDD
jgi:hypothetical protein